MMPPVRRIVTGHDAAGQAVVRSDTVIPVEPIPSGDAGFGLIWTIPSIPADNDGSEGPDNDVGLAIDRGAVLRFVDMFPGNVSPMHRTSSLDFGIVISGEVELLLDDGSVTLARAGDVIVQRGTIHAWRNPSADTVSRIAFVLIGATPATIGGVALPPIHP